MAQADAPTASKHAFYGQMFEKDKKPTAQLDALLRGIANYIVSEGSSLHTIRGSRAVDRGSW